MDEVQVGLIDDMQPAHRRVRTFLESWQTKHPDASLRLALSEGISERFAPGAVSEVRLRFKQSLNQMSGPLLLFVDFDLHFSATERSQIRNRLQETFKSLDNASHRTDALEYLESGEIEEQLDGIDLAWTALENSTIAPLLLVIQTGRGRADKVQFLLECLGRVLRNKNEVSVYDMRGSLNDRDEREELVWQCMDHAVAEFRRVFLQDPTPQFFQNLELQSGSDIATSTSDSAHEKIDRDCQGVAFESLPPLLGMKLETFKQQLFNPWTSGDCTTSGTVAETLKRMGTNSRAEFCASGAWLFALAAYSHGDGGRDWGDIFRITELRDPRLTNCFLTPSQRPESLRTTIRLFYQMCYALFHRKPRADVGPLQRVTLSVSEGLRFFLSFDPGRADVNRDHSLFEKLAMCREAGVTSKCLFQGQGEGGTTKAVWDWWIATSVSDRESLCNPEGPLENDTRYGAFGSPGMFRLNIYRRKGTDGKICGEVVFHD